MILGRSTVQWTALITAAGALAQVIIVNLVVGVDATLVATLIGSVIAFLTVFIAFLANTKTTPTDDPILEAGTEVTVKGTADKVIVQPTPPGPTGVDTSTGVSATTYTTNRLNGPDDGGIG